ncbi:MAG TPA: carboxypeptidase-like regulatory domain-containing protein [Acidobacteriaceae bacterium]
MIRNTRTILSPLSAIILGLLASTFAFTAYAQVVGGTISGTVTDATGAAIPNAAVVVHNDETGNERRMTTGADGRYAAPSVPVGSYTVTASAEGFNGQSRSGIPLSVGQSQNVNLALAVSGVAETITVHDAPPIVNISTQQTSGLVDSRQVKELPLNGRSYDQLVTLNPGTVNYTAQRSGSVGTSNSSVGNMFAVSGRRPQDNLYLLNGVEYTGASLINVTPGGTSGQLLGVEAVREFNVISDTYSAAYGKRQGAQVSIVTASGTNQVHGSAYEFLRNSFFDSRNYFDQARIPNFQRNNYGIALGGPIKRDKLFLFGNYEGYRQNLGLSDATFVPNSASRAAAVASVQPLLALFPIANGPDIGGGLALAYSNPTQHINEQFATSRFDANLTKNDLLFAVYTIDDSTAHSPTANPLAYIDESLREQVASVQEQHVFSSRLLNTARIGYSRASFYFLGGTTPLNGATVPGFVAGRPVGAIVVAGSTASNGASLLSGGANVGSNNAVSRNLYTADDHVFYTIGNHTIEAGGWVQRLDSNDNLAQNQYGQASFADVPSFLQGKIKTFTIVPSPTPLNWRTYLGAAYLEDTWHVVPRLELRVGFRSESTSGWNERNGRAANYGFTNGVINSTPTVGHSALTGNRARFLPQARIGIAWDAFGNGKTSVRASFGQHYSLLDNLNYRLDQSAPFNATLSYSGTTVATPTSGAITISPSNFQQNISTPAALSWTLRIEQQLAANTSLTLGYVGSHAYHQILSEDQNEPAFVVCPDIACTTATNGIAPPANLAAGAIYYPTTTKANPSYANTTSWVSQGTAFYHGLDVDFRRSFAHGVQFRANYTWSRNLDDGSAWNTSVSANTPAFVSVPQKAGLDWGSAATDVRHVFAVNGSYELPFGQNKTFFTHPGHTTELLVSGITLSTIANLQTGFPFTPQLGYNPTGSGDSRNPVRPDVNPNFHGALYTNGTTAQRAAQFFNPAAFSAPAYGTVGNLRRDTLTGPGYVDWDLSLSKSTQITERVRTQFRAEFFNVLNHTNLQTPQATVYTAGPTQGSTAATRNAVPVVSPTAGVVTSTASTSRQIQLGFKLLF